MDRIEQDKLLEKILGKRQVWFDRTDVEKILNTLYSEPQVCPKPEQMMICPKCSTDGKQVSDEDFGKTTKLYSIPACIPVPSTPASVPLPPELLTERDLQEFIEGTLVLAYMEGQANSNASATKLAKEIIAKCHQSEANIEEQLTEIVCSQYTRAEKAEARIKELEKQIHDMASGDVIREARADQNKKIGEEMMRHVRAESGLPPRWVADLIAKLQKGKLEG